MRTGLLLLFVLIAAGCQPELRPSPAAPGAYVAWRGAEHYYPARCQDGWEPVEAGALRWFDSAERAEAAGLSSAGERGCEPLPPEIAGVCTVSRIVDGDTLRCEEGNERVRLLLIDTPELSQRPYGQEASQLLEEILPPGTRVQLELDVQARDRYGRLLAYLYHPDGRMANLELARAGYAVLSVYPPNVRHVESIREAVAEARAARRGLWSGPAFECLPADHRAGRCTPS